MSEADLKLIPVRYAIHREWADFSGINLLSILGGSVFQAEKIMGPFRDTELLKEARVPVDSVTSMSAEVATEIHIWTQARQGDSFKKLTLQLKDQRITGMVWGFNLQDFIPLPEENHNKANDAGVVGWISSKFKQILSLRFWSVHGGEK